MALPTVSRKVTRNVINQVERTSVKFDLLSTVPRARITYSVLLKIGGTNEAVHYSETINLKQTKPQAKVSLPQFRGSTTQSIGRIES